MSRALGRLTHPKPSMSYQETWHAMPEGGGFCDRHGPFDPPHTTCPYCALEDGARRAYGPPVKINYVRSGPAPDRAQDHPEDQAQAEDHAGEHAAVQPGDRPSDQPPADGSESAEFQRQTVEPGITEIAPREVEEPDATRIDPTAGPEDDPHRPLGWLIVKEPVQRRGEVLPVRPNQSIGREGDIRWDDPRLSRQHARVTLEPLGETTESTVSGTLVFHLWPFAPTNPVIINGQEIRGATPLHENDEIRLGDTLFIFKTLAD